MGRDGRGEARGEKTLSQPVGCSPGGPGGSPTCHVAQHLDGRAWEGFCELSLIPGGWRRAGQGGSSGAGLASVVDALCWGMQESVPWPVRPGPTSQSDIQR